MVLDCILLVVDLDVACKYTEIEINFNLVLD